MKMIENNQNKCKCFKLVILSYFTNIYEGNASMKIVLVNLLILICDYCLSFISRDIKNI